MRTAPLLFSVALGYANALAAQDLPTVRYTSEDGLLNDSLHTLLQEPGGVLWIGGSAALSRFDGQRFIAYGSKDGLDIGTGVNHLTLDKRGDLWIATNGGGIYRFDRRTTDRTQFITNVKVGDSRASNRVNVMHLQDDGKIWAGTDVGVFVLESSGRFRRVPLVTPGAVEPEAHVIMGFARVGSSLWVGTPTGAYRCNVDRDACAVANTGRVRSILADRQSRLWIARERGVERWTLDAAGSLTGKPERFLETTPVRRIGEASDGALVLTQDRRVFSIADGTPRLLFSFADTQWVNDIVEDQSQNLWVATTSGLVGIRRQGVTLFSAHQRLRPPHLVALRRDAKGQPFALSEGEWVQRIDRDRVLGVRLLLPDSVRRSRWPSTAVQIDALGDIWLGTSNGLYRYVRPEFSASPGSVAPSAHYSVADGLASLQVAEVFGDSQGDIWIANIPGDGDTVSI